MIAVLLFVALAAPPPLRLADLLREARDKNPDLKAAAAHLRAAQSAISPAGALDDPMLMVQLWNTPADFSTVPVMVQLSQNIPLGGKRGARTDAARADAAMVDADLARKQRIRRVVVVQRGRGPGASLRRHPRSDSTAGWYYPTRYWLATSHWDSIPPQRRPRDVHATPGVVSRRSYPRR